MVVKNQVKRLTKVKTFRIEILPNSFLVTNVTSKRMAEDTFWIFGRDKVKLRIKELKSK